MIFIRNSKLHINLKLLLKVVFAVFTTLGLLAGIFWPIQHPGNGPLKNLLESLEPKYAKAQYQYSPSSQKITYGVSKANDFRALGASDGTRWELGTVAQGLDAVMNFSAVNARSANKIIVNYRGFATSTSLFYQFFYQIQICDFATSTGVLATDANCPSPGGWRNILDHGSSDLYASSSLATDRSYVFHIFNGYFSSTTGNIPINTPISNFINNSEMKFRFYSWINIPDMMLYADFFQVELVVDNFYSAGAVDLGNDSSSAGQYTDTFVEDVARTGTCAGVECLQITNSGDGVTTTFKFKNIATPYAGANAILIYESGYVASGNYYIDLCNSFDATPSCLAWDTLNGTAFSNNNAIYHTVAKAGISFSSYINNQNEIWARIRATGNYRMDYISLTVGSTNTSTAQSEISLGTNGAQTSTSTATLDSSAASPDVWQVNSALATSSTLTTTMYSDDAVGANLTTEYAVAANVSLPVTPPTNSLVTEIIWAARWTMSGDTTIVTTAALRTYSRQWRDQVGETIAVNNNQTFQMGVYGAGTPNTESATAEGVTSIAYGPIPRNHSTSANTAAAGWMEGPAFTITPSASTNRGSETAVSPWESIDPVTNTANLRIRTTDSTRTTAGVNLLWDFAFISIRYIDGIYPTTKARVTAQNGGVTSGSNTNSNWRFTLDNYPRAVFATYGWNIADDSGIADAWLEFSTTTLPLSANKLIITNRIGASADAANLLLMICDFTTSTGTYGTTTQCNGPGGWRVLNHVAGGYAYDYSAVNVYNTFQHEIYNGYFGTSTTVYDTPLSNFFQNGVARVRLLESGSTNPLTFYWKFSQLEIATDNFYSAAEYVGLETGTVTGSYTDAYMPEASCSSPYRCLTVAASSTASYNANFYLKYKNIATPYAGANAIFIHTTLSSSVASVPLAIRICNFSKATGGCTATLGWEDLNSQQIFPGTTLTRHQFIKNVTNWSDYISTSSEIWIGYYGAFTGAYNINLDYSAVAIGSVADNTAKSDVSYGKSYLGNALLTGTADTSVLVWDQKNCWLVNSYSPTSRGGDQMASVSAGIKIPAALPEGALPTALRWAAQTWTYPNAFTAQVRFQNFSGDYDNAVNAAKLMTTVAGTVSYDAVSRSDTSFTIADFPLMGVNIVSPEDYIDTVNNEIGFRWVTTTAYIGALGETQLYWDYAFVTLRYLIPDSSSNNSYRWYQNIDNATPTTALAAENTQVDNSTSSTVYRLRVNLLASGSAIATSTQFRLQYSEKITGPWFDVGATSSSAVWRFYDNPSVNTGDTIASSLLSGSNVLESYTETNPSALSPTQIGASQKGEFDFAIQNNNAKSNTSYFFSIARSDGFVYDSFNNFPKIKTATIFSLGDGLLVYGSSGGGATSQYRTWSKTDSAWSVEQNTLAASSTIRWVTTKASPVKNEFIAGQVASTSQYSNLSVLRYNGTAWSLDWSATTSSTTLPNVNFFDVAYENISGNAMVIYADNTATPKYRYYTATSGTWGPETSITVTKTSAAVLWVKAASRLGTNEISFAYYDQTSDLNVLVWNGSSWGSEPSTLLEGGIATITYQSFDLAYETASGDLDLFWGKSATSGVIVAQKLAGQTTWATTTSNATSNTSVYYLDYSDYITVAADPSPNSNYIAIALKANASNDLDATIWNGTTFSANTVDIDAGCEAEIPGSRMVDVGWVDGTAFLIYSDADILTLNWARWAPGSPVWLLQTAVLGGMGDLRSAKIYSSPDNTYAMVIHSRDKNNTNAIQTLWGHIYDGVNWRGILRPDMPLEDQLPTVPGAPYAPFDFAFAKHTPTLTQNNYQWFDNANSVQPDSSLADKNASTTNVADGTVLRVRMNVLVGVSDLLAFSQAFKLQYASTTGICDSTLNWNDVGLTASSTIWRGSNNSSPLDGELITSALLTSGNVLETYEEQNPSVVNTNFIASGASGEWDFVLQNNSAPGDTTYCFRLVKSDGLVLTDYNYYPKLQTASVAGITIEGTVYTNEGTATIDSGRTVRAKVNGTGNYSGSTGGDGTYTINSVTISTPGDVITVFLDNATENAVTVTRASSTSADISGLNLYQNRIIARHEDSGPITNVNLEQYDSEQETDGDIFFNATTSPANSLTVESSAKLFIWQGKTFSPGGAITLQKGDTASLAGGDLRIATSSVLNAGGNITIGGDWLNTGTFTHNNYTVTFNATSTGFTISDGGWPFFQLTFNGSGGEWLYQDSTSTAPATTTVQDGEATFLNAKTGSVSVTGGQLNVDWYLGIHVVDNDDTANNIGNATCTVSSSSTAEATIWKMSAGSWQSASTSQFTITTVGAATGTTPQPNSDGAVRIREYRRTTSTTTVYKYNLEAVAPSGFAPYNYYEVRGEKYLTSTSSTDVSGVDKTIYEGWHRNNISQMNSSQPYSGLNQPPQKGSWYIGMSSDLQFSVSSTTVNLGDLYDLNNWTATNTTILSATTSYSNGYNVKAYASNDGRLRLGTTTEYIIRWPNANSTPAIWTNVCPNGSSYCGFGYTTSDTSLDNVGDGPNRFATSTKYAGFATTTPGDTVSYHNAAANGATTTITYKVSTNSTSTSGTYSATIFYLATPNY